MTIGNRCLLPKALVISDSSTLEIVAQDARGPSIDPVTATEHFILYEPGYAGHQRVWLEILFRAVLTKAGGPRLDFVLHPRLADELYNRFGDVRPVLHIHKTVGGPKGEAPCLDNIVAAYRPHHLLVFELTQWERRLARGALPCRVSGILFVQYPEIDWRAALGLERWRRCIRRWIKERRTAQWLKCQKWGRVFLLQGERAASYLNNRFSDHPVFDSIADPLPLDLPCEVQRTSTRNSTSTAKDRSAKLRFLHIGVLSKRKGMANVLKALEGVSEAWAAQCRVDILGRVEPSYERPWQVALDRLRQQRPDLYLSWIPDELPEQDFREQIRAADYLLMPYLRTEYSSGLLGYAAALGTPILGAADGLIGRLIKEYGLGEVSATTPNALRDALERVRLDRPKMSEAGRKRYCSDNNSNNFARKFLAVCTA